ncbi:hypothetical protein [Leptothoe spongobia]|uniref:Uncharacterized protein n=1 Tax=Leptothoe spongobia TAU-MAC 1115 TaxID=1967444 RepID=A0A947DBB5_9CYAN|nr:hypothetical protein [Leptothoe spongobia]MBT9313893.1 hypothetical protein [Leptothoe spongobia TAU-MAC 1115]
MILKYSLLKFLKTGAVPLLLTTVALRQIILVHTAGLSPWHGGGFGMFASIDRDERRVVTTQLIDCSQTSSFLLTKVMADYPGLLSQDTYTHISTFPTEAGLHRMGKKLLSLESQSLIAELYATNREKGCDSKLKLQPWRLVYDGESIAYKPITAPVEVQP